MNLSLDYDGTYTRDPIIWDAAIKVLRQAGHKVYVVTMRYDNEREGTPVRLALALHADAIYFTGRKAKQKFMHDHGIRIDVWIDDQPGFIFMDAQITEQRDENGQ